MIHRILRWSVISGLWPGNTHLQRSGGSSANRIRLIPGLACSAAILLGLLMQSELRLPGCADNGSAEAQGAASKQPAAIQVRSPVLLSVDATKHAPDDPAAFNTLCETLALVSGVRPVGLPGGAEPGGHSAAASTVPDWYLWAQLNSHCSGRIAPTDVKTLQMYAVHSEGGGAVCIANSSSEQTPYVLKLRLPKGVFQIERLSFKQHNVVDANDTAADSSADGPTSKPSIRSAQTDNHTFNSELRRLAGCDNARESTVYKPGNLAPGEVAIIRFTDVARAARISFADLKSEIHNLAASTPGPAARLRRIVSQGDGYLSGLTEGTASTCQKRLRCIHRLILLMSQAESLHRNYQSRQSVNADPGARTMGALERIEDSLAETSAVLSGLVPQIELGPFTPPSPSGASGEIRDRTIETVVTISLANSGSHSVDSVKLGLDASALPGGSTCTPDDPAYFGSLHPGQSVHAQFKLKLPDSDQSVPARFVADVSYFTSGAPAHLRPRPW